MMRTNRVGVEGVQLELSPRELLMIHNALNEICNGLTINDFHARIGADRRDVLKLLEEFGKLVDASKS